MTNHVHLLASPRDARGIGKTLQSVGRRYVRYFNDRIGRTGTLWEGRYRATVIDTDEYLFRCCRYIEENPVRAGMVSDSSLYRWSSFAANASGAIDPLVTPHGLYLALGATPPSRQRRYRAIFAKPLDLPGVLAIRRATNHSWALGGEQFQHIVSSSGRRAAPLERGRPRIGV
jgi:putative transposase